MTMIINQDMIAMWFLPCDRTTDFLMSVFKKDDHLEAEYRFRYYDPEDPDNEAWSGKDKKSWYHITFKDNDVVTAINELRKVVGALSTVAGMKYDEILMTYDDAGADTERFLFDMSMHEWSHVKTAAKDEDFCPDCGVLFKKELGRCPECSTVPAGWTP